MALETWEMNQATAPVTRIGLIFIFQRFPDFGHPGLPDAFNPNQLGICQFLQLIDGVDTCFMQRSHAPGDRSMESMLSSHSSLSSSHCAFAFDTSNYSHSLKYREQITASKHAQRLRIRQNPIVYRVNYIRVTWHLSTNSVKIII